MSVYGTPAVKIILNTTDPSGSFILNQYAGPQTGNFWVTGKGRVDTRLGVGGIDPTFALHVVTADPIAASFSGRVIGANAVNPNEFITKVQLDTAIAGTGSVTSFSFTNGSGFAGIVSTPTTTPNLSLTTLLNVGSVPFIGAGGALLEDNAQLFWDNTNKRLAVGHNTPQYKLHVEGTSYLHNVFSSTPTGGYAAFLNNVATIPAAMSFSSGYSWVGGASSNAMLFAGSTSVNQAATIAGHYSNNAIEFLAPGITITMTQAAGIRAMAGLQVLSRINGATTGTISHGASLFVQGVYPSSTGVVNFQNYYGILLNQLDEWGIVTFGNRWGIYQHGTADPNYLGSRLQIGNVSSQGAYNLQVTGGVYHNVTSATMRFVGLTTDNTATQVLGKNAAGDNVWTNVASIPGTGLTAITANNGLTATTISNVQLGGSALLHDTVITAAGFKTSWVDTAAAGTIFEIVSTSTAAAGNNQKGLYISLSGAHGTINQTSYALYVSNTHTGSGLTNYAIYAEVASDIYGGRALQAVATGQGARAIDASSESNSTATVNMVNTGRGAVLSVNSLNNTGTGSIIAASFAANNATTSTNMAAQFSARNGAVNIAISVLSNGGQIILGSSSVVGTYRLEVNGGLYVDATANAIRFVGLATDNAALQVLAKNTAGDNVWRDLNTVITPPDTHPLLGSGIHTDTVSGAPVLGALIVGNGTPAWDRLLGHTVAAKRFLTQTGTGVNSAIPVWSSIGFADLPDLSTTYVPVGRTLTINGSAQDLSVNRTWTITTTGTTNRITVTGGAGLTPTIDIAATYAGQASIVTVGTITTGTWNGTAIGPTFGGTGITSYALGDTLYASATNVLSKLPGNITTGKLFLSQTGTGVVSAAPVWSAMAGSDITGAALTKTDDTNVTLTLGGTPATALLRAASIAVGWAGTLSVTRGGTGLAAVAQGDLLYGSAANTYSLLNKSVAANMFLKNSGPTNNPAWSAITAADIGVGAALTKVDDTNVTLTLTGTPSSALLIAAGITVGWAGSLAPGRGGTGITTYVLGDTLYASAANVLSKLSGNITAVKQFLSQTGTGAVSAAPVWAAITLADIGTMATARILGRVTAGTGVVEQLTGTQATTLMDLFSTTTTTKGVVPGSNNVGSTFFLRADGTWAVPPGSGGGGYTTLSQFVDETAWRMYYSNAAGDITPFALGTANQVLQSTGVSAAPTWVTIGSGTIGGTLAATQVAYGSAANTITGSANFIFTNGTGTLTLNTAGGRLLQLGDFTAVSSTTPVNINMGSSYSSVAGANLKLTIYDSGAGTIAGIGISAGYMDYAASAGIDHRFFVGANPRVNITSTQLGLYDSQLLIWSDVLATKILYYTGYTVAIESGFGITYNAPTGGQHGFTIQGAKAFRIGIAGGATTVTTPTDASHIGSMIQLVAGQTADAFQIRDSAANPMVKVSASGVLTVTASPQVVAYFDTITGAFRGGIGINSFGTSSLYYYQAGVAKWEIMNGVWLPGSTQPAYMVYNIGLNKPCLYVSGDTGNVGIGVMHFGGAENSLNPQVPLHIGGMLAGANSSYSMFRLTRISNTGVGVGMGIGMDIELAVAEGNKVIASFVQTAWADPALATASADFIVSLMHGGAAYAEKFRVKGTGEIAVQTLTQNDALTKVAVWDDTSKLIKYRAYSTFGTGTIGGSLAATQVAYGSAANTITGTPNFTFTSVGLTLEGSNGLNIYGSNAYNAVATSNISFYHKYNAAGTYTEGGRIMLLKENAIDGEYGTRYVIYSRIMGAGLTAGLEIDGKQRLLLGSYVGNPSVGFRLGVGTVSTTDGGILIGLQASHTEDAFRVSLGGIHFVRMFGTGGISVIGAGAYSERYGAAATASGDYSVALGYGAQAGARSAIAIGEEAIVTGYETIAIGRLINTSHQNGVVIGYGASLVAGYGNGVAVGFSASASNYGTALGCIANASGSISVAVGVQSTASGPNAIVVGYNSVSSATSTIAMGQGATANATYATAIGTSVVASGYGAIAIGVTIGVGPSGYGSTAMGVQSNADNGGFAVGYFAQAMGTGSIAIHGTVAAGHYYSIGLNGATTASNQLVVGSGYNEGVNSVFFGNGVGHGQPWGFTIYGTHAIGTDIAGPNIGMAGGRGTGTGTPGNILFSVSSPTTSGDVLQIYSTKLTVGQYGIQPFVNSWPDYAMPAGVGGYIQYNTSYNAMYYYNSSTWVKFITGGNNYTSINNVLLADNGITMKWDSYSGVKWGLRLGNGYSWSGDAGGSPLVRHTYIELGDFPLGFGRNESRVFANFPGQSLGLTLGSGSYIPDTSVLRVGNFSFEAGVKVDAYNYIGAYPHTYAHFFTIPTYSTMTDFAQMRMELGNFSTNTTQYDVPSNQTAININVYSNYDNTTSGTTFTQIDYTGIIISSQSNNTAMFSQARHFAIKSLKGRNVMTDGIEFGSKTTDVAYLANVGTMIYRSDTGKFRAYNGTVWKNIAYETGNGAWKVFYTDAAGTTTELAIGAAGLVLTSNGATAAPSWVAPPGAGGGGTPGLPDTSVQYNAAGSFAGSADMTFASGTLTLGKTTGVNLKLGSSTGGAVASPVTINMGGSFSSTAGAAPKLQLYNDGTYIFGIGVSTNSIDYVAPLLDVSHTFYVAGTSQFAVHRWGASVHGTGTLYFGNTSVTKLMMYTTSTGQYYDSTLISVDTTSGKLGYTVPGDAIWYHSFSKGYTAFFNLGATTTTGILATAEVYSLSASATVFRIDLAAGQVGDAFQVNNSAGTSLVRMFGSGGISVVGSGPNSERYGINASAADSGTAVGASAVATTSSVALGYTANASGFASAALTGGATASGQFSIAIGLSSVASGNYGTAVGNLATATADYSIAFGNGATAAGTGGVALKGNVGAGHSWSIALGGGAVTTAAQQMVIGGDVGASFINDVYIGGGVTFNQSEILDVKINASGGLGTDKRGTRLAIAAGRSTGTATGANILFQTSDPIASGAGLQALTTKMEITSAGVLQLTTVVQNDALTKVMVWDDATKAVRWRAASTLGGSGGGSTKFGKAGEDAAAAELRNFTLGTFDYRIQSDTATSNSIFFSLTDVTGMHTEVRHGVTRWWVDSYTDDTGTLGEGFLEVCGEPTDPRILMFAQDNAVDKCLELKLSPNTFRLRPIDSVHDVNVIIQDLKEAVGTKTLRYDPSTGAITYHDIPTGGGSPPTAPAGATTEVQYNNAGAFGASSQFTFASGQLTLNKNGGTNIQLGTITSAPSTDPVRIRMGASHSSVAGANPKIILYEDGTYNIGLGISSSQMDYIVPSIMSHNFYVGATKMFSVDSTNISIYGTIGVASIAQDDTQVGILTWNSVDKIVRWRLASTLGGGGTGTVTSFAFTNANGFAGTVTTPTATPTLTLSTSLTTGSVPFIGAGGALLQDNALHFWDDTNKRLGIGTNAPTQRLQVNGTAYLLNQFTSGTQGGFAAFLNNIVTIPAGLTFSGGYTWAGGASSNNIIFAGSTTIANGATVAGHASISRIEFSAPGAIIVMAQSTGFRAIAGLQILSQTAGANAGSISHGASLLIQGVYPANATVINFTNYYGILINQLDEWGVVTFGTKWAIYQQGANDPSYFGGRIQLGNVTNQSTTNLLEVTGGLYVNIGAATMRFVGLSTDNAATQILAKNASGNNVWRDVGSLNNPRVATIANTISLTIDSDTTDMYTVTAMNGTMTINNPSGTPVNGQKLMLRIKSDASVRTLSWTGSQWRAGEAPLPVATIANKTMYLGFIWNSADTKWDFISYLDNF